MGERIRKERERKKKQQHTNRIEAETGEAGSIKLFFGRTTKWRCLLFHWELRCFCDVRPDSTFLVNRTYWIMNVAHNFCFYQCWKKYLTFYLRGSSLGKGYWGRELHENVITDICINTTGESDFPVVQNFRVWECWTNTSRVSNWNLSCYMGNISFGERTLCLVRKIFL